MDQSTDIPRSRPPVLFRATLVMTALVGIILVVAALDELLEGPYARVEAAHANYLRSEGAANRGPAFQTLVLELDEWRRTGGAGGPAVTEASMVKLLGPPDLMSRDASGATFVYFYDRFAQNDWAIYFNFVNGGLTIAWNATPVNAPMHAQMSPYAPPAPTTSPTTVGS